MTRLVEGDGGADGYGQPGCAGDHLDRRDVAGEAAVEDEVVEGIGDGVLLRFGGAVGVANEEAGGDPLDGVVRAEEHGPDDEGGAADGCRSGGVSRRGQREDALIELRHAAATFIACGARRYCAAADQELRRMGDHSHRRSRRGRGGHGGIESLTDRELQVAHLVVDRRTNAEIADALFLSPTTIETHVRNTFHKLDVSSRVDLARTVERLAENPQTTQRPPKH